MSVVSGSPAPGGSDLARIQEALAGLSRAIATDGYAMIVKELDAGKLSIEIEAGDGACAECLVSPEMMAGLVRTEIPADIKVTHIALKYPDVAK